MPDQNSVNQRLDNPTFSGVIQGDIRFSNLNGILDDSENEVLLFQKETDAVNQSVLKNAATGNSPSLVAAGTDTDIDYIIKGKGTGNVLLGNAGLKFPNADGTAGQVLETNGIGGLSFVDVAPVLTPILTLTAAATITIADRFVIADASGGAFTITLPTAVGNAGKEFAIKRINTGGKVTIDADGTELIDDDLDFDLTVKNQAVTIVSNNVKWFII